MAPSLRVLFVEDSESDALLVLRQLRAAGYQVTHKRVETAKAMNAALNQQSWDVVIADYTMPRFRGTDALDIVRKKKMRVPFIFVSGTIGEDTAVAAMKAGAQDYILKTNLKRLVPAIQRELREADLRSKHRDAAQQLKTRYEEILALQDISRIILTSPEVKTTLDGILARALSMASFDIGIIRLSDPQTKNLRLTCSQGFHNEANRRALPEVRMTGRSYSKAMIQKKPFVIDNLRRVNSLGSFKKEGVQSAVAVPVCAAEEVLGVLLVGSRKTRTFRRSDVRFLEFIGNQMGIAVQKAQLYEKARTQTEELEKANAQLHARARREAALAELGQSALATADLTQLMNESVALVAQTLRVDLCKILELLPDEKALLLRAGIGWKEGLVGRLKLGVETSSQARYTLFSGEPVIVEDVKTETRFSGPPFLYDHGVVSGVSVVIQGRERPFGVLGAYTVRRQTFAPDDIHFLQAVANVLSVTIERKHAEEALGARYQELVTLKEIGQTILASQDIKTVLDTILDQAVSVGAFDMGSILIVDSSGKHLDRVAVRGYRKQEVIQQQRHRDIASEQGRFRTLKLQEPRVEENVPASIGSNRLKREGVQSAIMVPVRASDTVFGVIQLGSRRPRKFLPGEVRILETLGHQMGIAIQKHRLYEQTSRNLERIRALHEIDTAITSTLDLPKILEVLLEKIDLFLPYTAASGIRLLNNATGELAPVACRNLDDKEWKADPLRGGQGIGTALKATKVPLMIADMQKDPRTSSVEFVRKNGLVSFLGAPLIANDEFLGVLSLYTKEEHEFTKEDVEFVTTLGSEAAIAIQNAKLYADLRNQAIELERANKVKSEFLSVMSHELRTPLNVIMGYTALIQDQILGEINDDQERALERLSEQSNELLHLISSIMEATKIEAGSMILEKSAVNLKALLEELKNTLKSSRDEVAISWTYPRDFPSVVTDGAKLKQIMQGLIGNALKFTEQGSVKVSVSLGKSVETAGSTANRFLRIEVKDTGIGIPRKALPTIFEIFRQLDSSETRAYGGLGLGLYLVKRYTELLGGKIEVESEEGKGSTFVAVIPVLQTLQ